MPSLRKSLSSPRRRSAAAAGAATSTSTTNDEDDVRMLGPTITDSSGSSMGSTVTRTKKSSGSSLRNLTRSMSKNSGGKLTSSMRRGRKHSPTRTRVSTDRSDGGRAAAARSARDDGEDVVMMDVDEDEENENENEMVTCENCGHFVPTRNLTLHAAACAGGESTIPVANVTSRRDGVDCNPITLVDDDDDEDDDNEEQQEEDQEDQWACPRCTLLNQPLAIQCGACRYVRPDNQDDNATHHRPISSDGIRDPDPSQRLRLVSDEPVAGEQDHYLNHMGLPPLLEGLLQQHEYMHYERQHQQQQLRRRHQDSSQQQTQIHHEQQQQQQDDSTTRRRRQVRDNDEGTQGEVIVIYDDDEDGGVGFAPQHSSTFAQHEDSQSQHQVVERYHSPHRHGPSDRDVNLGATISESSSSSSSSAASASAPTNLMGGGAFLGGLLGGAMAFGRGRSISSGALEGAVTGAAGGAILSELWGAGTGASSVDEDDTGSTNAVGWGRGRGRGTSTTSSAASGLRRFLPGGGGNAQGSSTASTASASDGTTGTQFRIVRMGPDGTVMSTSNRTRTGRNDASTATGGAAGSQEEEAMLQMILQSIVGGGAGAGAGGPALGGTERTLLMPPGTNGQQRLIFMRNPAPGQVRRQGMGGTNGTIMLPPGMFLQAAGGDPIDQLSYDDLLELFGTGGRIRAASPADISSLPTTTIAKASDLPAEKKSCSICLCEFENGDSMKMLPCLHGFHENCVDRWLGENGTCPVCKHSVVSGS